MRFINFVLRAFAESPLWWRMVSTVLAAASFLGWIAGETPHFISSFWPWWFLLVATLCFISVIWGAFRIHERESSAARAFQSGAIEECKNLIKELSSTLSAVQSPLAPGWGGTENYLISRVASFQCQYWNLIAALERYNRLSRTPITIPSHRGLPSSPQIVTVPDLINMLVDLKEEISKVII